MDANLCKEAENRLKNAFHIESSLMTSEDKLRVQILGEAKLL